MKLSDRLKDRLESIKRARLHYRLEKDWIKAGFRYKISLYRRMKRTLALYLSILSVFGCASHKGFVIIAERPKVSVVYPSYQAVPWQTVEEVSRLQTLAYFQYHGAQRYRVTYLTPFGKIPFQTKEVTSGHAEGFWPNVLVDFNYDGDPSRLVYVAKDTVYAIPCYLKVQAWNGEKWSEWSELVKVE